MSKYCENCETTIEDESLNLCDNCIVQAYEQYIEEIEQAHFEQLDAEIELREAQYSRGY